MGALDGILVVSIEQAVAAPMCTQKLADQGARVVKIERSTGETARHYDDMVRGVSSYFTWLNRGKESAVLDLKSDADQALLARMLGKADVLVQNLAPGAMARMGMTEEVLERDYPHLICANILGYGQDTEYSAMKAYDLLVQAESGVCAVTGAPDTPAKVGVPLADIATGTNAYSSILAALIERSKTGRGQSMEIAMFDGMAEWMTVPYLHWTEGQRVTGRYGMEHSGVYPYRPFTCQDGTLLIAVQTETDWTRLCGAVLNLPELLADERYSSIKARHARRAELNAVLEPAFAKLTLAEAKAALIKHKIAWAQFSDIADLPDHPALRQQLVRLPDGQEVAVPRPAGPMSEEVRTLPTLGQHTDAIRAEFQDDR